MESGKMKVLNGRESTMIDLSNNISIIRGDCIDLIPLIPDNSVDLVVTDPPFNILNKTDIKFKNRADIVQRADFDVFDSYDSYLDFTKKWVTLILSKMKENSSFYCFFASQYVTDLLRICESFGMEYRSTITWHKTNPPPSVRKSTYVSSTETVLYMTRGRPAFNFIGQNEMHNFVECSICMGNERIKDDEKTTKRGTHPSLHPSQKPVELIKHFVLVSSNEGELVVDPFSGTGTTPLVARITGRKCVAFESNEKYWRKSINRLQDVITSNEL